MATDTTTTTPAPKSKLRGWVIKFALLVVLIFSGYIYWFYFNVYSQGDRIGKDVKISNKGNVFKTTEGYLTEGCRDIISAPTSFVFSVQDKQVEEQILALQLDPNACIRLQYEEYRRTLPWRGDSKYIIISAQKLDVNP
jgi:hypothetical protein